MYTNGHKWMMKTMSFMRSCLEDMAQPIRDLFVGCCPFFSGQLILNGNNGNFYRTVLYVAPTFAPILYLVSGTIFETYLLMPYKLQDGLATTSMLGPEVGTTSMMFREDLFHEYNLGLDVAHALTLA
jgi:hypothetical protein